MVANSDVLSWIADSVSVCVDYDKLLVAEELYNRIAACGAGTSSSSGSSKSSVVQEIKAARMHIEESLKNAPKSGSQQHHNIDEVVAKLEKLEKHNAKLEHDIQDLRNIVLKLEKQVTISGGKGDSPTKPAPAAAAKKEDDEEIDLFGSDDEEEDAEKEKLKAERVKAYQEKKEKKPALIAKSSVILDVKPWDDETDMKELENSVRTIVMDGLLWGASKLVPLAYGIKKLQIMCVVEDEKVSIDELQEKIQEFEDYVQSVDIAAFNKI